MSAVKIIFKRSSVLGKRPTSANLEAGEIGLNTNSNDPGIFFEVSDGSVVKAGPTSYLSAAPTPTPSLGELWVDTDTKALNIGTNQNLWQKVAAPFLGGTNGFTVFVAPEYENATDSLTNDGQTVPFITINRAIIEVTKRIIQDTISGLSLGNNKYLILLAPGRHCVVNSPGKSVDTFSVNYNNPVQQVTQEGLSQFNTINGGLILPRGVSIIGLDLKKCEIYPTYVPKYTHPAFPNPYQQTPTSPVYANQPSSSIFSWSGNTYLSNFTGLDKIESRNVVDVSPQDGTNYALFTSAQPHGLGFDDFVQVSFVDSSVQVSGQFQEGQYYTYPVTSYQFLLSTSPWNSQAASPVPAFTVTSQLATKLEVKNIYPYFVPTNGVYETHNYSHHRLSLIKNASFSQLNEFYVKVQKAYSNFFGNTVFSNLVSAPEVEIVAPTTNEYPKNITTNSTDNTSPYQNMVNHRSDYGMANGDYNYEGTEISGFKSVIVNSSTAVVLQKDPVAYEVYSSSSQNWSFLTVRTKDLLGISNITSVPTSDQLQVLNDTSIPDLRYYYSTLTVTDGEGETKSIGLPNPDDDFRHFGFRVSGPNSYMQAQSTYTIGAAIAVWAKNGAYISLTNATTNFGSVAFQAEGFSGIGTLSGANDVNKNFLQTGTVCPVSLFEAQVSSSTQKRILSLGSEIVHVGIDPNNSLVQQVYLNSPFNPATILPYSLKPGTAIFISNDECAYRGFFVTDGSSTCILSGDGTQNPFSPGGCILRLRLSDSTIPNSAGSSVTAPSLPTVTGSPYIRRFIDPRTETQKAYGLNIVSTSPVAQAPSRGSVLRLNQTSQDLSKTLRKNFQFDPGFYGGYAQTFTVDLNETTSFAESENYNNKISDSNQSVQYTTYLSLTDAGGGWLQSLYVPPLGFIPYDVPSGYYQTYQNKNYYAAENNLWSSLYYDINFSANNGPTKRSPQEDDSPYVPSSVLERSEPIEVTWQGQFNDAPSVLDPVYQYYVLNQDIDGNPVPTQFQVPDSYKAVNPVSYFRGATVPYSEYSGQFNVDNDDGTDTLGIVYYRKPVDELSTVLLYDSVPDQSLVSMTPPWVTPSSFGRPATMELNVLSLKNIVSPRESISILKLSKPGIPGIEYVRVVNVTGTRLEVIRNYYSYFYNTTQSSLGPAGWNFIPNPGTSVPSGPPAPPLVWPAGTVVTPCVSTNFPEPVQYDPDWSVTKITLIRYFQLLGFPISAMRNLLVPRPPGQRRFLNTQIPSVPVGGYANLTASYPIEFNNPSTITANTHTWQFCGFFDYSRGLPKYQVNQISRKLLFDFLSTTTFGGRLTVAGVNDNGDIVSLGTTREAITGNLFVNNLATPQINNGVVYQNPEPIAQPSEVVVFSTDDISGLFDGSRSVFDLTRGGYPVPPGQLSLYGTFVTLGGVVQKPGQAYTLQQGSVGLDSRISFSEAPEEGTSCDIRVVTSEDEGQTLEVINFTLTPEFDDITSNFVISPTQDTLTNLNSFLFLGGTEQNPAGPPIQDSSAYSIFHNDLSFIGDSPQLGTVLDFRGILSGDRYRRAGISSVFVSSVDDISLLFNDLRTNFPLTINGVQVDSTKVNAEGMFVSIGGVMQIPVAQEGNPAAGNSYTVQISNSGQLEILFSVAPPTNATCNIRIITSDEVLTCPLPPSFFDNTIQDGPGVTLNSENQIVDIDSGEVEFT